MLRMSRSEVRAPTRHLTLRVSPDLVAELERLANREKRSRSSLVKEGISLVLARSKAKTATRDRWLLSRLWPLVTAIMSSDDKPSGHAPFLDAPAAAELLGVPASWLRAQARADQVPHMRLGKYTRFGADELLAWARERRHHGPSS
jgi:Arc/MetJ-type ribon-helix-helix transcriptional regulator